MIGIFRWMIRPNPIYFAIALGAGIIGGLLSKRIKNYQAMSKVSFWSGALVGVLHGAVVFFPMFLILPWFYLILSVGFLAVFEGTGVFIFMGVVSGILREEARRETERELLRTQIRFLQAQISPHFLYNALNTIATICGREGASQARGLVLKLAAFLRGTLKRAEDMVTFREEIAYIDSYVELEKARFQDRLQIKQEFSGVTEESWNIRIPFLILQPLVENAIKHGISKKEEGGTVQIFAREYPGGLEVEVIDDGMGSAKSPLHPDPALREKAKGLGIGTQNINERMIRLFGPKHAVDFQSEKGKGTKVTVRFPNERMRKDRRKSKKDRRTKTEGGLL